MCDSLVVVVSSPVVAQQPHGRMEELLDEGWIVDGEYETRLVTAERPPRTDPNTAD